ncbi:MAG: hypothetical protein QOD00_3280 [Blastocatellia bacterium]|jgi:hypothetical protein|nr:hypothetical protein [Blastocatellia bacterium]
MTILLPFVLALNNYQWIEEGIKMSKLYPNPLSYYSALGDVLA